jgi:hypothetical protein
MWPINIDLIDFKKNSHFENTIGKYLMTYKTGTSQACDTFLKTVRLFRKHDGIIDLTKLFQNKKQA